MSTSTAPNSRATRLPRRKWRLSPRGRGKRLRTSVDPTGWDTCTASILQPQPRTVPTWVSQKIKRHRWHSTRKRHTTSILSCTTPLERTLQISEVPSMSYPLYAGRMGVPVTVRGRTMGTHKSFNGLRRFRMEIRGAFNTTTRTWDLQKMNRIKVYRM